MGLMKAKHTKPEPTPPEKKRRRTIAILVALGSTVAVLAFGAWMSEVFNPLLLAALLAYICNPVVTRFQPIFKKRLVTIVFIYGAVLTLFLALPLIFLPSFGHEMSTFGYAMVGEPSTDDNGNGRPDPGEVFTDLDRDGKAAAGELFRDVNGNGVWDKGYFDRLITDVKQRLDTIDSPTKAWLRKSLDLERVWNYLRSNVRTVAQTGTRAGGWMVQKFFSGVESATTLFSYLVLVPIYAFFLLWNSEAIVETVHVATCRDGTGRASSPSWARSTWPSPPSSGGASSSASSRACSRRSASGSAA